MQEVRHITPDQLPHLLAQNREQLTIVNEVVENKTNAMSLLDEMSTSLMANELANAMLAFVAIQRIEYTQQLRALHLQQSQIQSLIHQLENPVSIPTMNIGPIPPPPGSKGGLFNPPRR